MKLKYLITKDEYNDSGKLFIPFSRDLYRDFTNVYFEKSGQIELTKSYVEMKLQSDGKLLKQYIELLKMVKR